MDIKLTVFLNVTPCNFAIRYKCIRGNIVHICSADNTSTWRIKTAGVDMYYQSARAHIQEDFYYTERGTLCLQQTVADS